MMGMSGLSKAGAMAWSLVCFTAVAILAVMGLRMFSPREAHIDVPRDRYPVKGIDVSSHNGGDIDFEAVAADSVDFVYIKASEGNTFRDTLFYRNYAGAVRAGLKVGAYHYFRFDCEGWRQGRNLLDAIDRLSFDLPLAIDVEEWGNVRNYTTDDVVRQLTDMVDYLHEYGYKVIIYTNRTGYNRFIRFRLDHIPVWISSFYPRPLDAHWTLWQHSHKGRVSGIEGVTDLDTFNGSRVEWESWLEEMGRDYVHGHLRKI